MAFAASLGISVIALTDHDTVDGLPGALKAAADNSIQCVPGVELSINCPTGEFHLLGLGINPSGEGLSALLSVLAADRLNRNSLMIEKMQAAGFTVSLGDIEAIAGSRNIGRPHFAEWLVRNGTVRNRQKAFDKYLGQGRPIHVRRTGADLDEAINAIKASGGIPVLAHPLSLYISWGRLEKVIPELHERGIVGIEAWHPAVKENQCRRLEFMARQSGMFVTAGSDFHGKARDDRKLGRTAGGIKIADRFWTEELQPILYE
jgi:predicted metal-dependent phosphoesterase TrpH